MSTILDALRKVEEEKRSQEPDIRTRLLTNTPRFDLRMPRRSRVPWIVGGVITGTCVVLLGSGLAFWYLTRIPSSAEVPSLTTASPVPHTQAPPQAVTAPPPQAVASAQPRVRKMTQAEAADLAMGRMPAPAPAPTPVAPAQIVASEQFPVTTAQGYNPWTGGPAAEPAGNAARQQRTAVMPSKPEGIQRSPFVNSSPYDQIVAPQPFPAERPVATATPTPARPRPRAAEKKEQSASVTPTVAKERPVATPSSAPAASAEGGPPPGTSLTFLQWSADPEKRVASIKIGSSPATIAHEGESIEGITVVKIRPDAVELRSGNSHYVLKAQ